MHITRDYLKENPDHIFVFGDNVWRIGHGGAAILRDEPNTYGFITKRAPNNNDNSFFRPKNYRLVFDEEFKTLKSHIWDNPSKTFLISKLGAGLANRYNIWEEVIRPQIGVLSRFSNVFFLFKINHNQNENK